jgi:uncharacterized protein (TIGR00255 family)
MIRSMTGFGKDVREDDAVRITIELKSLNSKLLDINCRLPSNFRGYEIDIRNLLGEKLQRGKIDCSVTVDMKSAANAPVVNESLASYYFNSLRSLTQKLGVSADEEILSSILKMPEIFQNGEREADEKELERLKDGLVSACEALDRFRINEGKNIAEDFVNRINAILQLLEAIEPFENARIERVREKIRNNLGLSAMENQLDENRFEQELIYYIEKLDITEEKVRLKKHCEYFLETMELESASGKKLSFICQEIGREINTLGSKASDADIQQRVVLMKDELEKIKEQVFNIL